MKKIKDTIAVILLLTVIIIPPIVGGTVERTYFMNAEVVLTINDKVVLKDETGNLWDFFGDDFIIGEMVKVRFDTNGTDYTREDDIVEKVKKL